MTINIHYPLKSVCKTPSSGETYNHYISHNFIKAKINTTLTSSQSHHFSPKPNNLSNLLTTSTPSITGLQKKTNQMELESWLMTRWTFSYHLGTGPIWTDFHLPSYSTKPPFMAPGSITKCMDGTAFALNIFKSILKSNTGITLDNKNLFLVKA